MGNAPKKPDTSNWDKKTQEQKDRAILDTVQKDGDARAAKPSPKKK